MVQFILKRVAYGILVMLGVVGVVFGIFNLLPVDPARLTMGQRADVESVEAINKELGWISPNLYSLQNISMIYRLLQFTKIV